MAGIDEVKFSAVVVPLAAQDGDLSGYFRWRMFDESQRDNGHLTGFSRTEVREDIETRYQLTRPDGAKAVGMCLASLLIEKGYPARYGDN